MRRFVMAFALTSLSLGLAVPLVVAQERGGIERGTEKAGKTADKEMMKGCEEVSIDRPFAEVARRLPDTIDNAGLILAGDIDWLKLSTKGMKKGPSEMTPRLLAASSNVHTFLVADDHLVNKVLEDPKHGFWIGKIIAYEEGGKTKLIYGKPSVHLDEAVKRGVFTEEKAAEYRKHAQEYEKKLEQVVNDLKNVRKD